MEKTHMFRSAVLVFLFFSNKCLRLGSPWGLWKLELLRRHHLFEAMFFLRVSEPRKIMFGRIRFFEHLFIHIFWKFRFRDIFFMEKYVSKTWGWGQLWFWGSGPENYSSDLPPDF